MAKEIVKKIFKKEDIPVNLETRVYNGNNYEIGITLFSPFNESISMIKQESIKQIIIGNDLECFTPQLTLMYKDMNNVYANTHEMIGQFLRVVIKQPTDVNEKTTPKYFDNIYMIVNARIIDFAVTYSTFEFEAVHESIIKLNRHINYATNKNLSPISPYKVITDVLKKAAIDVNEKNVTKTTNRIHYITTQEQTVKDVIKYGLAAGVNKDSEPAFYYWNMIKETPYIWSMNLDMGEENNYYGNFGLTFYTGQGGNVSSSDLLVRNVSMINANPVDSFIQESGLDIVWNYDQLNRTWNQTITTPYKINKLLSPVPELLKNRIKSNFKIYDYNTYGIRQYHSNFDFLTLYKKYRDMMLGTNTITIDVRGLVVREVGQTIELKCNDDNISPLLGGRWKIYRILHVFEGNNYNNSIVLFRTFSLKEKKNE